MTTIVLIRKNNEVVVAGDGQVSMGNTVIKSTAAKVRKIEKRNVIAGFAGSTADALTLFERLEAKLEKHAGNLPRAAVELAKDWRTDKYLRRLEALMAIGDKENSYIISGTGDVLEPEGKCYRHRLWWKLRFSSCQSFIGYRFKCRRSCKKKRSKLLLRFVYSLMIILK